MAARPHHRPAPRKDKEPPKKENHNKPAASFHQMVTTSTSVQVAVWINVYESNDGTNYEKPNITVRKSYKDERDGQWKEGSSFTTVEAAVLAVLLQEAQAFIQNRARIMRESDED